MSQLLPSRDKDSNPDKPVTFRACVIRFLLFALVLVSWVALAHSTVHAEGEAIGRGFTGMITEIQGNSIIVQTKGPAVQLFIDEQTNIEAPPDDNLGFEYLRQNRSGRIAVLADRAVTNAEGSPYGSVITAKRIILVPSKATRFHRRAITTEIAETRLQTLDAEGRQSDVAVADSGGVGTGQSLVLLVRSGGQSGLGEQVRGFVHSAVVDSRLERLEGNGGNDPLYRARLAELKRLRESANQQLLARTADNANATHRDFLRSRADQLKKANESLSDTIRPLSECTQTLLGRKVGRFSELTEQQKGELGAGCLSAYLPPKVEITFPTEGAILVPGLGVTITAAAEDNVAIATVIFAIDGVSLPALTAGPYSIDVVVPPQASSMDIKATAFDEDGNQASTAIAVEVRDTPPTVKITAPLGQDGDAPVVGEGQIITISADADDDGAVATVVFTVNGIEQASITAPPYSVQYTVPATPEDSPAGDFNITAIAIDNAGNTSTDSVTANVTRPTAPVVRIIQPVAGDKIAEGGMLVITAETDDDSVITSVTFTIDGLAVAPIVEPPFSYDYLVPAFALTQFSGVSSVPPHVFVGTASINGGPAPDGTSVVAYVTSARNASLVLRAAATNTAGQTGTTSLSFPVAGAKTKAGQGTVTAGKFLVNAEQPDGASYGGKEVTFTVAGVDADQTGIWKQGGADLLELTAGN